MNKCISLKYHTSPLIQTRYMKEKKKELKATVWNYWNFYVYGGNVPSH